MAAEMSTKYISIDISGDMDLLEHQLNYQNYINIHLAADFQMMCNFKVRT